MTKDETVTDASEIIRLSNDNSDYKNRLKAIAELSKCKSAQSINILLRLMKKDKVYSVQRAAFYVLQGFNEDVKLPKKKKGHLIKDINHKLLKVHNLFRGSAYDIVSFKILFKQTYPELYDIYNYEKDVKFDEWIGNIIKNYPKKRLKNLYKTRIDFDCVSESLIYEGDIEYRGSTGDLDKIKITDQSILIEATRVSIIKPIDILNNESNTIYTQIIKALLFYYMHCGHFVKINQISIERIKHKILESYILKDGDLRQVLNTTFSLDFSSRNIIELFNNGEKSVAIFNAISFLLKSFSTSEPSDRFEKLWKSFNAIYRYIGGDKKEETKCHIRCRGFIISNQNRFIGAVKLVTELSTEKLRDNLRLRDMILNDYETKSKTIDFASLIMRNKDYRICELMKQVLGVRENFLKDINSSMDTKSVKDKFIKLNIESLYDEKTKDFTYNEIVKYLNNHIREKTVSDIEVITFICIKYAYYVRNKIFHAEKHDLSFRLMSNNEINGLTWLNDILQKLIIDLLENNDIWISGKD